MNINLIVKIDKPLEDIVYNHVVDSNSYLRDLMTKNQKTLDLCNVNIFLDNKISISAMNRLYDAFLLIHHQSPHRIKMTIEQIASYIDWLKPEERIYPLKYKGSLIEY